ncbi:MYND finger family protein [Fonsecaea pedrosoi]|nr:MYND finger family protein [Fonsecaea pedrosoi]
MLGRAVTPTMSGFYPVGNTPPVDVLEAIPPGQDAAVLLLGCGDARNLLFSLYSRPSSDQSHFDITCCDVDAEIIARNILLYTLLIDDVDGADTSRIWNIYYHWKLDQDSLHLLQKQARKLVDMGTTIENWRQQTYGQGLRFCDQGSFDRAVKLWKWYALDDTDGSAFEEQQKRLKHTACKAVNSHRRLMGGGFNISTLRSAAPCSELVLDDMVSLLHDYWVTGVACGDAKLTGESKCLNPTFSTMHGISLVYASMEPLQSFHLATAYAPLKGDSPLDPKSSASVDIKRPAQAAARQFQAWAETFRRVKDRLKIRFTASDAGAFCHVLQHHAAHKNSEGAFQYRDRLLYEQLVLDPVEYDSSSSGQHKFDVIETSNLVDHLGSLNILAACRPLLKPGITSTIYMELLQLRDQSLEDYTRGLLCGEIVTVSLLFGLSPIQYWTNTTGLSHYPESMARSTEAGEGGQARFVIAWKNVNVARLRFDSDHLARFVFKMCLRMFEHESSGTQTSNTAANRLALIQFPQYTRSVLATILGLIKGANFVDFPVFMERLRVSLHNDSTHTAMNSQYTESLDLSLQELRVCTITTDSDNNENAETMTLSPCRSWLENSSAACLTVAVPHASWAPFIFTGKPNAWPLFELSVRLPSTGRESRFGDVQIGFGVVRTSGTKGTSSYAVDMETDEQGAEGCCPLIVSALVPSCMLVDLNHSTVAVQFIAKVHGDSQAIAAMESILTGRPVRSIEAYRATLSDQSVFITENPPNLKGRMPCPSLPGEPMWQHAAETGTGNVTLHMIFDGEATRAKKLNLHIDLTSTDAEALLQSNGDVEFKQLSAFNLELNISSGSLAYRQRVRLPVALITSGSRTRIARKSVYVEFIARIAAPDALSNHPGTLYPMTLVCGKPILENLGYLHLEHLPIVDTSDASKLIWMEHYLSSMLSMKEKEMMRRHTGPNGLSDNLRLKFKQMLLHIFSRYPGLGGKKPLSTFNVLYDGEKVPLMTVVISSLRLDLANLSIVLDAAMLPSTAELGTRKAQKILAQIQKAGTTYEVDSTTRTLWENAVAAFVERCRDWEHTAMCEYAAQGTSTVPTPKVDGNIVCSCGLGKFPQGYKPDVPGWTHLAKHCVRMAISPSFSVPMVEKVIEEIHPWSTA